MAGRWRDPASFRADPAATRVARPNRRQALGLLIVLLLVAGAAAAVSYLVRPDHARSFDLFHGSDYLASSATIVGVDLASGTPTGALANAATQVGAKDPADMALTALSGSTLVLNRSSGEFNLINSSGFMAKTTGGVPLPDRPGSASVGIASGASAYIEQTGPTGTSVYLVSAATVQQALASTKVKPRASRSLPQSGSADPGAAASSNGTLWVLVGSPTGTRSVTQLSVPPKSSAGAVLRPAARGTVRGAAALATATLGSGSDVVGLASADRVQLFGQQPMTLRYRAVTGLDTVLPATGSPGRLSWLLHGTDGWSLVSVAPDGSGLRGPTLLPSVAPGDQLAAPAGSRGMLYTIDRGSGQLLTITADGAAPKVGTVPGAASYPRARADDREIEGTDYSDAVISSQGTRVVVNSPSHIEALMLFTDGSHRPATILKTNVTQVNAAGGAEALTKVRAGTTKPGAATKPGAPKPRPAPAQAQAINNRANCKDTTQKPHIPQFQQPVPGSRSVLLKWTYPTVGSQDCVPQTYQLSVKLLSSNAPQPQHATVPVGNQTTLNLGGLYPSSQYAITLTAYIGEQGTSTLRPLLVTTGPAGPDAPLGVHAAADHAGNWTVGWNSCGTAATNCVPAQSWTVISRFCDGRGLGSPPASQQVTGDPSSRSQPGAKFAGGDALLGRGLSFQVEGHGAQGTVGTPSASTGCIYSSAPPVAGGLTLTASKPANTTVGSTTTTTATLDLGANPIRNVGGVGATVKFALLRGGSQVATKGPITVANQSTVESAFTNVRPGANYTVRATVNAPHGGGEATLSADVQNAQAAWPTLDFGASSCTGGGSCLLSINVEGVDSSTVGESFTVHGELACGSASKNFDFAKVSLPLTQDDNTLNQSEGYYGKCTLSATVSEASGDPRYFGGSTNVTAKILDLGAPVIDASNDFDLNWAGDGSRSSVAVRYTGGNVLFALASNFSITVSDPDGKNCGSYSGQQSLDSVPIDQGCINDDGAAGSGWSAKVSFTLPVSGDQGPYSAAGLSGAAPSYNPACNVAQGSFSASWGGTAAQPTVSLHYGGGDPGGCSNFVYTLAVPDNASCSSPNSQSGPPNQGQYSFTLTCTGTLPASGWSIGVHYDIARGGSNDIPIVPDGAPPTG